MAPQSTSSAEAGPSQAPQATKAVATQGEAAKGETSDEAKARAWIKESPWYEPQIMSPLAIQRCQQYMRWSSGSLFHLWAGEDDIHLAKVDLASEKSKSDFERNFEERGAAVDVFFFGQRFEHLSNGTSPRENGVMRFSINLDEAEAIWLFKSLKVHPLFIECLNYNIGHFAVLNSFDEHTEQIKATHILIKIPPAGHLEAAYYLRYDHITQRCLLFVTGNDLDGQAQMLLEHLQATKAPHDPFALILVLLLRNFRFLEAQRRECDHAVIMTERETGRGAVAYSQGEAAMSVSPDNFDLTFMHWIEGNQRNILYASEYQARLAAFLLDEHLKFLELGQKGPVNLQNMKVSNRAVHERLFYHKVMGEGLHDACYVIRERIQRQLNAADSIINQYDNKVSIRNAEISTQIAERSRQIAAETRRDSTSMKTIAGLTMIYLPSTFAASVFSTGFFAYEESQRGVVKVNPQIWKLFVVAATLSAVTTSVWVWLNKRGIPRLFNWVRHSPRDGELGGVGAAEAEAATGVAGGGTVARSRPKINLPAQVAEDAV